MTITLTLEQWHIVREFADAGIEDREHHAWHHPADFDDNASAVLDGCSTARQILADLQATALTAQPPENTPASEQHRIACQAQGWQYVTGCPTLLRICGEDYGIAHLPTIYGDASHNDSVYCSWTECFAEALGGQP